MPGGLPGTKEWGNCEFARGGNEADGSLVIMGRGPAASSSKLSMTISFCSKTPEKKPFLIFLACVYNRHRWPMAQTK